ncbi:hypothetical protein J4402_01170 [Candidatus Pacearchaeota archaeon]|nr:hypothetical protein [Candidatus Pacearchaeota archaeon]
MGRRITEEEKKKYNTHGLVKVIAAQQSLDKIGEYFIEIPLNPQPARAWLNRGRNGIEILIAGDRIKNYSERSVEVDGTKKLIGFAIDLKKYTNKEAIIPRYQENGNSVSS